MAFQNKQLRLLLGISRTSNSNQTTHLIIITANHTSQIATSTLQRYPSNPKLQPPIKSMEKSPLHPKIMICICISTRLKQEPYPQNCMTMNKFKVGDLVFAHLPSHIWPAKIEKTYNATTFRIEFYNHDSIGIVDQKDLELINRDVMDMYSQKFGNKSHRNQKKLVQAVRLVRVQFERREELRKKEAAKWKDGVPSAEQKRRLELLMQAEYKRVVYQPLKQKQKQKEKEKQMKAAQQERSLSKGSSKSKSQKEKNTNSGQKGRSKRVSKPEPETVVEKSQPSRTTRSKKVLETQTNFIGTRATRSKNQDKKEKSLETEQLTGKRELRSSSKNKKVQSQEAKKKYQSKQKKIKKKLKKQSKPKKQTKTKQPPKDQSEQQPSKSSTPEDRDKAAPQNHQQPPNPAEPAQQPASNAQVGEMIEERQSQQLSEQEAEEEIIVNEQIRQSQIYAITNSNPQLENVQLPIDNPIQEQPLQQINQIQEQPLQQINENVYQIPQPICQPQHLQQQQPVENMNCDFQAQQNYQPAIQNAVEPEPQYQNQEYAIEEQQGVVREQVVREEQVKLPIMNNLDQSESSHEANSKPPSNVQQQTFYLEESNLPEIEGDMANIQNQQQQDRLQYSISPQFTPNVSSNQPMHIQQHQLHHQNQILPQEQQSRQQPNVEQLQQQPYVEQTRQQPREQQQSMLQEEQQQQLPHQQQPQQHHHQEQRQQQYQPEQPQYQPCEQQQQLPHAQQQQLLSYIQQQQLLSHAQQQQLLSHAEQQIQQPHVQQQLFQQRGDEQIEPQQSNPPQIAEKKQTELQIQEQTRQQNYHQQIQSPSVKEGQVQQINQETFENLTPLLPNPLHSFIYSKRNTSDLINLVLNEDSKKPNSFQFPDQIPENAQPDRQPTIVFTNHSPPKIAVNEEMPPIQMDASQKSIKMLANSSDNLELSQQENSKKQFQRLYCDFSINNNDFIAMVQGIPSLKKKLLQTDFKLMAMCFDEYLQILRKFITPQNTKQPIKNLQMWQRQLLIAIISSDILDIKTLVQYEIMFRMMAFVQAFEKNKTHKRAQCHVEYLMVSIKLDTYIGQFIKERNRGLYSNQSSSYDRLIREYQLRTMS